MPKKTFEGEGNPVEKPIESNNLLIGSAVPDGSVAVVSDEERRVLKVLLDRDRTSKLVHGGLKSLLALSDDDSLTLLGFLDRI